MARSPSRLFVLGQSPLPTQPSRLTGSGNLRTWHFVKPLLDAGHTIRLVTARMPGSLDDDEEGPIERSGRRAAPRGSPHGTLQRLGLSARSARRLRRRRLDRHQPLPIVAAGAARLRLAHVVRPQWLGHGGSPDQGGDLRRRLLPVTFLEPGALGAGTGRRGLHGVAGAGSGHGGRAGHVGTPGTGNRRLSVLPPHPQRLGGASSPGATGHPARTAGARRRLRGAVVTTPGPTSTCCTLPWWRPWKRRRTSTSSPPAAP